MYTPTTRATNLTYAATLLLAFLPLGLLRYGWTSLATGHVDPFGAITLLGSLIYAAAAIFRTIYILWNPKALGAYHVRGWIAGLRYTGYFFMQFSVIVWILGIVVPLAMSVLMKEHTESGAEYFVVRLGLSIFGGCGIFGLILFELSRTIGFEKQVREDGSFGSEIKTHSHRR